MSLAFWDGYSPPLSLRRARQEVVAGYFAFLALGSGIAYAFRRDAIFAIDVGINGG